MLTRLCAPPSCLLYTHLPLDGFPSAAGPEALCRHGNSLPRPCPMEQLSPAHPLLVACQGADVRVPGTLWGWAGSRLGETCPWPGGRGSPRCSDRTQAQGKSDGGQSMGGTAGCSRPACQLGQHLLPSGALTLGVGASGPHPYTGYGWSSPPAYCEEVAGRWFTSGTGHSTVMKLAGHGWAGGARSERRLEAEWPRECPRQQGRRAHRP